MYVNIVNYVKYAFIYIISFISYHIFQFHHLDEQLPEQLSEHLPEHLPENLP